jgi:hypothetical protein
MKSFLKFSVDAATAPLAVLAGSILTAPESDRYIELEETITRGLETFMEVAVALLEIRDRRLYRGEYGTFEDYCQQRWGMTARRGQQLMAAAGVVEELKSDQKGSELPQSERVARELGRVPKEERKRVWDEAVKARPAGKAVTAKGVKEAAEAVKSAGTISGGKSSAQALKSPDLRSCVGAEETSDEKNARKVAGKLAEAVREIWDDVKGMTLQFGVFGHVSPGLWRAAWQLSEIARLGTEAADGKFERGVESPGWKNIATKGHKGDKVDGSKG